MIKIGCTNVKKMWQFKIKKIRILNVVQQKQMIQFIDILIAKKKKKKKAESSLKFDNNIFIIENKKLNF